MTYTRLPHGAAPVIQRSDYKGREYDRFYVRRDSINPGWFVFGIAKAGIGRDAYDGDLVHMLCARPDVASARWPKRNGNVRLGWRTKAEAAHVARAMNEGVL